MLRRAMEEIDVWRAANLYVKRYGADVGFHAALRADALAERGDWQGQAVWRRILRAIEGLQNRQAIGPTH